MVIMILASLVERNQVGRIPRKDIPAVTICPLKLAKNNPSVHHVQMGSGDKRCHEPHAPDQQVFNPVEVGVVDSTGMRDAMVHRVDLALEPPGVEGAMHPIQDEVVKIDKEEHLANDYIPGR